MVNQELLSYIRTALSHGLSFDAIRTNLRSGGWTDQDIDEAVRIVNSPFSPSVPPTTPPTPTASNAFQTSATFENPKPKGHKGLILFIVIFIIILLAGGTGFAIYKKWIPLPAIFDKPPYNEENFISGISFKSAQIKTSKYSMAFNFALAPRDPDAIPYEVTESNTEGLVALGELINYFPEEFNTNMTITAQTDFSKGPQADMTMNIDAIGDYGDLAYKFNIDVLKKDKDLYFKINNIPSLLLGFFPIYRDQWFQFNLDTFLSGTEGSLTEEEKEKLSEEINKIKAEYEAQIKEYESSYQKNKEDFEKLSKTAVLMAEEKKLIRLKSKPVKEEVDGRSLYKYELTTTRENYVAFVEKLIIEMEKEATTSADISREEGEMVLKMIKDPEFKKFLEYLWENASMTLWIDEEGFPAIIEQKTRIVPPDEIATLSNKQLNLSFIVKFTQINEPVIIDAPTNTKDLGETIIKSLNDARNKANNANIKANMSNMRAYAEIYFNEKKGSYGKISSSGNCKVPNTLFASSPASEIVANIERLSTDVKCFSSPKAWAMSTKLIDTESDKGYWCVDSTGEIKPGEIPATSTICP